MTVVCACVAMVSAAGKFTGMTFFEKSPTGYVGLLNQGELRAAAMCRRPRLCLHRARRVGACVAVAGWVARAHAGATCYLNSLIQTLFMTPGVCNCMCACGRRSVVTQCVRGVWSRRVSCGDLR
jgi:hypothetical protein